MSNCSNDIALLRLRKFFSSGDFIRVTAKLSSADSATIWRVQNLPFKDPTIAVILNLVMGFGIGAFYVGKIGYAVAQVICYLILIPLYIIVEFSDSWAVHISFIFIACITLGLFIAGVINARKWAFEYNYKKFAENISML